MRKDSHPGMMMNEANSNVGMVEFDLQILCDPRLFGVIAAHGFVDFACPSLLGVYALALVPLGSVPTTTAFLTSSIVHFGKDCGAVGSALIHTAAGAIYLINKNVAFSMMMAYSLLWHIPGAPRPTHQTTRQKSARALSLLRAACRRAYGALSDASRPSSRGSSLPTPRR